MTNDGSARPRQVWRPLVLYLIIQGALVVAALVVPRERAAVLRGVIVVVGSAVFAIGVARRRPRPLAAWWLLVSAAVIEVAVAVGVAQSYGVGTRRDLSALRAPAALIPSAVALVAFACGLLLLSRVSPYGGIADMLDAVMIAVGGFLLVWTFLVEPRLGPGGLSVPAAVVYPVCTLVLFAMSAKLVLGGALRDGAVRLLVLATMARLIASVLAQLPAISVESIRTSERGTALSWAAAGFLLGAVGLHPDLNRPRRRMEASSSGLSRPRLALYVVLAMIAPGSWAVELIVNNADVTRAPLGFTVPAVTSAVFLLLLVGRLGLISRALQGRAHELAGRSAQLSSAVSEQRELQQKLAHRAMHDSLTGLSNRTVLNERLDEVYRQPRDHWRHALLLMDLDGFKDVNDTLGHPTGDELLVEVARRLRQTAPPGATLARLGGDEFAVLLERTEPDSAQQCAHMLLAAVSRSYSIGGRELFLTTSVGLLVTDPHQPRSTPSEMLRDADLALYAAKEAGKNRIVAFDPELRSARLRHTRLNNALRHALANDEFILHYQPMVEPDSRRVRAVEALLRWRPEVGRLLPAAEFISIAEDSGLILPIGDWVLRAALRDAARWYSAHRISVSVNVSGRQLDEADFADTVMAALTASGLPGDALVLEIAERTLVNSSRSRTLHQHLRRLRANGVRVAVDDFGTGYSSLSYVAELPVDIVKIDKSFTQGPEGAGFAPREWDFTKAILQLVESLNKVAVAKGVRTEAQAEAMRILHCPLVQGFLFGRPEPAEAIDRILDAGLIPSAGHGPG